ncbi:hypothetical protein PMAA_085940 [Talaromyces marneffei ATCC 18224]|uniref:Uncharacterized protein n=2 Tax=Talaromyces marneffei TaxID=37727 RepID=B6QGL6_TALMQ|nr:hypothetical protein PMAA_085940 [Talaromyces marneffei ATCC 18224]
MTAAVTEFMTETRGVIRLVHLSEHFLFVQASGYCTAWELSTYRSHQIRLPSPHILEINARHDRAIILIGRPSDGLTILSWHFDSDSVRSARIEGKPLFTCWASDDNDTLFVVQAEKDAGSESYKFFRQRFAITDHEITSLDTKVLAVEQKLDLDFTYFLTFTRFNQLICRYGTVISQILPLKSSEPGLVNIFITYSTKTEALEVHTPIHKFDDDQCMQYFKGKMLTVDGTIYYPIVTWSHFKVNQILDETNVFYARMYSEILPMYNPNRPRFVAFGDHQLFGIAHTAGIEVWAFDPRLQFAPDA